MKADAFSWILLLTCLLAITPVKAKEVSSWRPPAIDYDWVQLTSGEWLKGEIKGMYNDVLEFDSDKLDLVFIKWVDVKFLQTYLVSSVYIEEHGTVTGIIEVNQDEVTVGTRSQSETFDRSRVVSFITGANSERDLWNAKITLGVNIQSGNTIQEDYTTKAAVRRQSSATRFLIDYIGAVTNTRNIQTSNNHRLSSSLDLYRTRRFYQRPVFAELFRDRFKNIRLQSLAGTGLGYKLIDTGRTEWNVSSGVAGVYTSYDTVQAGSRENESTPAFVFDTVFDIELTSTRDFIAKYNAFFMQTDSGGYTHHLELTYENEFFSDLDISISAIWDRISHPRADENGDKPLSNDFRFVFGLAYSY